MAAEAELLDIAQAAALLQVSEASLRRWTNRGLLPCLRIGGRRERRFRRADLMAFAEGHSTTPMGHLCGLYTSDLARTRQAAARLSDGLEAGSVCFLSAQADVRESVLTGLARQRPSLRRDLDAGRLVAVQYRERVAAQLEFWEDQWEAAIRGGASSLCVVGDVSGSPLAQRAGFADVLEYEAEYEKLSQRFPLATACLYDARTHSGVETAALLRIHPDLFRHPIAHLVS